MVPPSSIHFCYAEEDREYAQTLKKYLLSITRESCTATITTVDDVLAGQEIDACRRLLFDEARSLILFMSVDFLNCSLCVAEMKAAFKRLSEIKTFLIICRPCAWTFVAIPSSVRVLPASHVSIAEYSRQDAVYCEIATVIGSELLGVKLIPQRRIGASSSQKQEHDWKLQFFLALGAFIGLLVGVVIAKRTGVHFGFSEIIGISHQNAHIVEALLLLSAPWLLFLLPVISGRSGIRRFKSANDFHIDSREAEGPDSLFCYFCERRLGSSQVDLPSPNGLPFSRCDSCKKFHGLLRRTMMQFACTAAVVVCAFSISLWSVTANPYFASAVGLLGAPIFAILTGKAARATVSRRCLDALPRGYKVDLSRNVSKV